MIVECSPGEKVGAEEVSRLCYAADGAVEYDANLTMTVIPLINSDARTKFIVEMSASGHMNTGGKPHIVTPPAAHCGRPVFVTYADSLP